MKKILIAIIGIMILSGCSEDVLNLKNPTTYTEESYYKNQKECEELLAACYSTFTKRPFYARDWYFMFDLMTGQATRNAQLESELVQFEVFNFRPETQYVGWAWYGLYQIALRGMLSIEKLEAWETKTDAEAAYKDQMIGEANFFIGWAYYFLTELFGDVPVQESWDILKNDPYMARVPYAEVQKKIETSFNTALAKLPESWASNFLGRATKDAARAMLGKLYLTQGKNDQAISALESIKNSSFAPDYYKLFTPGNHTSPEIIFQIEHKYWNEGNQYYMWGGKESGGGKVTHSGRHLEYGWNDWANVSIPDEAANKFRYTVNGHEYLDPRNQFIMYGDGTMGDGDYAGGKFPYLPRDPQSTTTGYKWKKYCFYEESAHMNMPDGSYSSVLIRVSDIKLLLAEAYIAKGNYDKAKELINLVRTRDAVKAEPYNDVNAGNAFDLLKRERYIELFGEQQYWFDLVRWDRLGKIDLLKELGSEAKALATAKHKKFPIPTQEKDTNPKMVVKDDWN